MAYKLTHPDGGEIEADVSAVAMYESQGWLTKPTAKPVEDDGKK